MAWLDEFVDNIDASWRRLEDRNAEADAEAVINVYLSAIDERIASEQSDTTGLPRENCECPACKYIRRLNEPWPLDRLDYP